MTTLTVGYAPQPLVVVVSPEVALQFKLQQTDDSGPVNWPVGTTARLEFAYHAFILTADATVTGALLSWALTVSDTASIPPGASARIYLNVGDGEFLWLAGRLDQRG